MKVSFESAFLLLFLLLLLLSSLKAHHCQSQEEVNVVFGDAVICLMELCLCVCVCVCVCLLYVCFMYIVKMYEGNVGYHQFYILFLHL